MFNQLRVLKRKTKDLRVEVRNLRRITQAQAINIKETIRETFTKIKVKYFRWSYLDVVL